MRPILRWVARPTSSLVGLVGLVAAASGCGEASHIFKGRLYLSDRDCVATTSSVDVVAGDPPGACDPACLVQPLGDGGRSLYVSTMCPPYPFGFDASGSDPLCPAALDALARGDTCLRDGGSANPAPSPSEVDGGPAP